MSRRPRRFSPLLLVPVAVAALTVALAASSPAVGEPSPTGCANRVNDSPDTLLPCIRTDDLWRHMQAFQAIADANPGPDGHASRNSGEPGYKASVDYVANLMQQAGYDVTIQTYKFFYFAFTALPVFAEVSPTAHTYTVSEEWSPGQSTGSTTADLQPANGIVIPASQTPSSTSGCTSADFNGFVAGRV